MTFLDKDGNFDNIRRMFGEGEDLLTDHDGGDLALAKYDFLLDEMPQWPFNDISTWKMFWLDENGQLIAKQNLPSRTGQKLLIAQSTTVYSGPNISTESLQVTNICTWYGK